jgi:hypothetical protein
MALTSKKNECGSATIEFCLSALVWVPLLLGTTVFGINLIQAIQLSQLSRATGHMYAYGIDFTQPQNLPLLERLSSSLQIQQNGGQGAIVLSKITLVTDSDCAAADMKVCTNNGKYVFTSLYVFGNSSYAQTKLGNPGSYLFSGTAIQASQYMSNPGLVATNFSSLLTFLPNQPGQYAFVSEVSINSQAIAWSDFSNTGSYARTIF